MSDFMLRVILDRRVINRWKENPGDPAAPHKMQARVTDSALDGATDAMLGRLNLPSLKTLFKVGQLNRSGLIT